MQPNTMLETASKACVCLANVTFCLWTLQQTNWFDLARMNYKGMNYNELIGVFQLLPMHVATQRYRTQVNDVH